MYGPGPCRGFSAGSRLGSSALMRELQGFKRKATCHRRLTFEGAGEHDDLVVAVALTVWWAAMERVLGRATARVAFRR